jgi:hypothetical protein
MTRILPRGFFLVEPILHSGLRFMNVVGLRHEGLTLPFNLSPVCQAVGCEISLLWSRVHDIEPDIMTAIPVFCADITQSEMKI